MLLSVSPRQYARLYVGRTMLMRAAAPVRAGVGCGLSNWELMAALVLFSRAITQRSRWLGARPRRTSLFWPLSSSSGTHALKQIRNLAVDIRSGGKYKHGQRGTSQRGRIGFGASGHLTYRGDIITSPHVRGISNVDLRSRRSRARA